MIVGFIGIGEMGFSMAANLLKHKFPVVALDSNEKKLDRIVELGASVGKTPTDVASKSDAVILCLPHPDISRRVIFGNTGIVRSNFGGKTLIETSTLTPDAVVDFYERLKLQSVDFLCAPMFGGATAAYDGRIHFVVEGDEATLHANRKIFLAMGKKITYVGKPPQATLTKLARNICRFANVATAIEAINFLRAYTKNVHPIYNILVEDSKTNFDHVWEKTIRPYALEETPYKASHISVKDLHLVRQLARRKQLEMPITSVTFSVHKRLHDVKQYDTKKKHLRKFLKS